MTFTTLTFLIFFLAVFALVIEALADFVLPA
jgi:hypothetical protein